MSRVLFVFFLIYYFFQFYLSMLYWLWIEFHNLYWFAFYWVISVSWSRFDRLNWVDSGFFLSLFNCFLFNFIFKYWVDWELIFNMFFDLFYIRLSLSHDLGCRFYMWTWINSGGFKTLWKQNMKFSYNNMKNIVSISNHARKNIMKFFVTISILEILNLWRVSFISLWY